MKLRTLRPESRRTSTPINVSGSNNYSHIESEYDLAEEKAGTGFHVQGKLDTEASCRQTAERIASLARRRFQQPEPFVRGASWNLTFWRDVWDGGQVKRKKIWKKLCPASTPYREVKKIADEIIRQLNTEQDSVVIPFLKMTETYIEAVLPTFAKTTRDRYLDVINNHLLPAFGHISLRDLKPLTIQKYFSGMGSLKLARASMEKIRVVLSSILNAAVDYQLLSENPAKKIRLLRDNRGKPAKPHLNAEQFHALVAHLKEPYATMVVVGAYTGLRVSELLALRWGDVGHNSITVDERYTRGDLSRPKTQASCATISVSEHVIARIRQLKQVTVEVRAGRAIRRFPAVKSSGPDDLVFQAVEQGGFMDDQNILSRHLKPAAKAAGISTELVNWRSLRTSRATWLIQAGADVKATQALMRHSKVTTTLDIYAQFVPETQLRANEQVDRLLEKAGTGLPEPNWKHNGSSRVQ
jgi:integrase